MYLEMEIDSDPTLQGQLENFLNANAALVRAIELHSRTEAGEPT